MAYRIESVKEIKIRVFKWEQNMIKNNVVDHYYYQLGSSSRFGFLVLTVKNQIEIIRPLGYYVPDNGEQARTTILKKGVQPFKIAESPNEFVKNIEFALRLSDLLFKDTIPHVANVIFDYLSSSFEIFGEKLNLLGTKMDDDDEFHKIVVVINVDMSSKQIGIGSERSMSACSFVLNNLYETLTNNDDNNNNDEKTEIHYAFDDFNVQEILNALFDFFTLEKGFLHKAEGFVGKIQKFRVIKSGLKIMKLKMENVAAFELGDICPVCLKIFEEESVVVITPCSHMFHRRCVFTWLSKSNTCPICREGCSM
ncbi:hypothetical protein P3S68_032633 [Capsicum galapagoense]